MPSKLLPQNICSECIATITSFLEFCDHANNVQKTFQKKYLQLKDCSISLMKTDIQDITEPETILKVELVDNEMQDFSSDAGTEYNEISEDEENSEESEVSSEEEQPKKKRKSRAKNPSSKKRKRRSDYGRKKVGGLV